MFIILDIIVSALFCVWLSRLYQCNIYYAHFGWCFYIGKLDWKSAVQRFGGCFYSNVVFILNKLVLAKLPLKLNTEKYYYLLFWLCLFFVQTNTECIWINYFPHDFTQQNRVCFFWFLIGFVECVRSNLFPVPCTYFTVSNISQRVGLSHNACLLSPANQPRWFLSALIFTRNKLTPTEPNKRDRKSNVIYVRILNYSTYALCSSSAPLHAWFEHAFYSPIYGDPIRHSFFTLRPLDFRTYAHNSLPVKSFTFKSHKKNDFDFFWRQLFLFFIISFVVANH